MYLQVNPYLTCLSLSGSGVATLLGGSSAAAYPHALRGLVEEGAEGERTVWPHGFPHLSAEELHPEETSQYMFLSDASDQSIMRPFSNYLQFW